MLTLIETILDKVVHLFMDKYLSTSSNLSSLGQVLHSEIEKDALQHDSDSRLSATTTPHESSLELIKEIDSLHAENDALKVLGN